MNVGVLKCLLNMEYGIILLNICKKGEKFDDSTFCFILPAA
jgi:hypothetical protein